MTLQDQYDDLFEKAEEGFLMDVDTVVRIVRVWTLMLALLFGAIFLYNRQQSGREHTADVKYRNQS